MKKLTDKEVAEILKEAEVNIHIGAEYIHYKGSSYEVIGVGIMEATNTPCVIYKACRTGIVWVRTLEDWLRVVEFEGKKVARFTKKDIFNQ